MQQWLDLILTTSALLNMAADAINLTTAVINRHGTSDARIASASAMYRPLRHRRAAQESEAEKLDDQPKA